MKFEARDILLGDTHSLLFTGECDDQQNITKIEGTRPICKRLIEQRPAKTITELVEKFPRLNVILEDGDEEMVEEEVHQGDIVKLDPERRQVFGWAYVSHDNAGAVVVDRSGEFIEDIGVLEASAYQYVIKSRAGGADHKRHNHKDEVIQKSTMIESMVFTPEKIASMGIPAGTIPQGAWWCGFQIEDEETWERFKSGELTAFSVHGKGIKKRIADE